MERLLVTFLEKEGIADVNEFYEICSHVATVDEKSGKIVQMMLMAADFKKFVYLMKVLYFY